jgi:hypothetical protein
MQGTSAMIVFTKKKTETDPAPEKGVGKSVEPIQKAAKEKAKKSDAESTRTGKTGEDDRLI